MRLLNLVGELLGAREILPDCDGMSRYYRRLLFAPREEAQKYWREAGISGGITSIPEREEAGASAETGLRSFTVGTGELAERVKKYCQDHSVTLAALLHYVLGRVLCRLLGLDECSFLSVTSGRNAEMMALSGMFVHRFPFIYHSTDTIEDCQQSLLMARDHVWLWCLAETAPFSLRDSRAVVLDIINVYGSNGEEGSIPYAQVLDGAALTAVYEDMHREGRKGNGIFIESTPALNRLYYGTYAASGMDGGFIMELSKELAEELCGLVVPQKKEKNVSVSDCPALSEQIKEGILPALRKDFAQRGLSFKNTRKKMIYIWGTNQESLKLYERLSREEGARVTFVAGQGDALLLPGATEKKIPLEELLQLRGKPIDRILIPVSCETFEKKDAVRQIRKEIGIDLEKIWIIDYETLDRELVAHGSLSAFLASDRIPFYQQLQYEVAKHYNLKCKGCSHFAPLSKRGFGSLEAFTRDLERIRGMIDQIGELRLMGGEPLLNDELHRFVYEARRIYPHAQIR